MKNKIVKLSQNKGINIGTVFNVDTRVIIVKVDSEEILNDLHINDIILFDGVNQDQILVGLITKISKKIIESKDSDDSEDEIGIDNYCNIALVGTYYDKLGASKRNVFVRSINSYPEINSIAFKADDKAIEIIMNAVSNNGSNNNGLEIGKFAINKNVRSILDGNKFFQRHACIVGSTGSGKSWTVANVLEKINKLEYSNVILFDLHGEYNQLSYAEHIKIGCDPNDIKMPLWFFKYEEIHSIFIESSEGTSSNYRAVVVDFILNCKKEYCKKTNVYNEDIITVDTAIPFRVDELKKHLEEKNDELIDTGEVYKSGDNKGQVKTKQGSYFGKLTNLINRLQSKMNDKKYDFIFNDYGCDSHDYLNEFANCIMGFTKEKNIKVIDLSEVPSDILPIIIGTLTRIVYDIQFWMSPENDEVRHPLVFVCDEAHIYMPNDSSKLKSIEKKSLDIFEKIAKEGRKYGIGLLIVSQRPAELNTTIFSQCNNLLCLKISNDRDRSVVKSMLMDSLAGLTDILPNLDIGESIAVGDAIMLPSKIILDKPQEPPKSATIDFWSKWKNNDGTVYAIDDAIDSMIKQSRK